MDGKLVTIEETLNGYVVRYRAGEIKTAITKDEVAEVFTNIDDMLEAVRGHFEEDA